ncbi:YDL211C [Saccharomyces arboricola H-6]|uniref:YDL211C n=1 Tax=Saccharomyces arboricola (strain H-6 / AS 2.3317 / CBS 10644) TaxID=1160507 RepID=J8QA20_SACAR|nr:YDL211C [Saccharomyces arboricola H-6]
MLLNVTSSRFINRQQHTNLDEATTKFLRSSLVTQFTTARFIEAEATINTECFYSPISSGQDLSLIGYNTPYSHNYTSSPRSLAVNYSSSVKSNITIDRWLISSPETLSSFPTSTTQPSTTELMTPLLTTFASTITSKTYSVFTSKNSLYVVYDQEYEITESTLTFNTHFPQTTVLKESNGPLAFTIPPNTITGNAKLYQVLSGALNTQDTSDESSKKTGVIVGSTVGVIIGVVVLIFIGFVMIRNKRNVNKGFSHDIGKRVSACGVVKEDSIPNPFLNELNYKGLARGESKQNPPENGGNIRRDNSSDSLYIAYPYYGIQGHESGRLSYLSSQNGSTGSSTEETGSNTSTITRPDIEQMNSFLREII